MNYNDTENNKRHADERQRFDKEVADALHSGFQPVLPDGSVMELPTERVSVYYNGVFSCGFGDAADPSDPIAQRGFSEASQCAGTGRRTSVLMGTNATMLDYSQQQFMPVADAGTPGLGFAVWGPANYLPTAIFKAAAALPFTASALDYLERTLFGIGPEVVYCLTRYAGGTVTHEEIPYRDAELYLRNRVTSLLAKLDTLTANTQADNISDALADALTPAKDRTPDYHEQLVKETEKELEEARKELNEYKATSDRLTRFLTENNVNYFYKRWIADTIRLGICFPMIGLTRGPSGKWNPDIARVDVRDACVMRLEERNPDNGLQIDNVYYSERWREDTVGALTSTEYVAYPAVMPEHAKTDLDSIVRKNNRKRVGERPYWICCPNYTPTPSKPYYPQLPWWSIFPSQVYQYASTLIYDKSSARKNSTMWGKILFINTAYLAQIFAQAGEDGKTPEGQKKIRNGIYEQVENFLKRRDNNGKLLVMDSYPSADEKQMIDSVRIVDVPRPDTAKTSATEVSEIASLTSYSFGINMDLVGSRPGTAAATTGTAQRELHLLKNGQLAPDRVTFTDFFNNFVFRFNKYSPRFRMVVKYPTLTTLDASKTGYVNKTDSTG